MCLQIEPQASNHSETQTNSEVAQSEPWPPLHRWSVPASNYAHNSRSKLLSWNRNHFTAVEGAEIVAVNIDLIGVGKGKVLGNIQGVVIHVSSIYRHYIRSISCRPRYCCMATGDKDAGTVMGGFKHSQLQEISHTLRDQFSCSCFCGRDNSPILSHWCESDHWVSSPVTTKC